jgi:hypothetical protein
MATANEFEHRGRLQAQSDYLDESESWARHEPLSATEGHELLETLRNKLEESERRIRQDAFAKAHRFIDNAGPGGVGPTSKSFPVRGRHDGSRVDIEVRRGIAFAAGVAPNGNRPVQ